MRELARRITLSTRVQVILSGNYGRYALDHVMTRPHLVVQQILAMTGSSPMTILTYSEVLTQQSTARLPRCVSRTSRGIQRLIKPRENRQGHEPRSRRKVKMDKKS